MYRTFGVAIGAGLASALLFAASAKGAGPAIIIAYVTPLPIMIAALGFSQGTGLMAAGIAFCGIAGVLGLMPGLFFAALLGLPSWWLCYLLLLARPLVVSGTAPSSAPGLVLWYPVGRVAAWGAAIVAAVILASGGFVMLHYGGYEASVTAVSTRLTDVVGPAADELTGASNARSLVKLLPVLMAASVFLMLMVNLWLAGRTVERSGLLARPWPSLPENFRLPRAAAAAAIAAGILTVAGSAPGLAGGVVAAAFGMAFVLQGLGAAHALTRGLLARRAILLAIYFITFTVVPSILALGVLGVVDCLLPLRNRPKAVKPPLTKS